MGIFSKSEETNSFFEQLILLSAKVLDCVMFLEQSLSNASTVESRELLKGKLREVKEIHTIILDDLHSSFITPIDREDIFTLSNALSEFAKYSYSTIDELFSFGVSIDPPIAQMIKLVRKQAEELKIATERLDKNPRVATEHLNQIRSFEEQVEKIYRRSIFELMQQTNPENLSAQLLRREVYRHISNMSDKAISVAKTMGMIVMKLS